MPTGLKRFHQEGDTHFLTFSCFRRQALLGTPDLRDLFLNILKETCEKYETRNDGWVIMPEHVHLLLTPHQGEAITAILQVIKQRYSRALKKADPHLYEAITVRTAHPPPMPVWESRFYDFNVRTEDSFYEKLRYIHNNPLKRGLVIRPQDWKWSSYSYYLKESQRRYAPHPTLSR